MTKDTILFDLGGTLAYYYEMLEFPSVLQQAVAEVQGYLLKEGMLTVSSEEISQRVKEEDHEAADYRIRPLEERLYRIFQLEASLYSEELAMKMCRCFMKPIFARGRRYEDTIPALNELRSGGFKTGIVSNTSWGSPAALWREEIDSLGLGQMVDAVIFCRCGLAKTRPSNLRVRTSKTECDSSELRFRGRQPEMGPTRPPSTRDNGDSDRSTRHHSRGCRETNQEPSRIGR